MIDFENLNAPQKEAVQTTEGPLLVIAGAGSGKTRVLTYRIAYLISEKQVKPYNILAITFTNKAAKEMKERVTSLLGKTAEETWISTFHSLCVKILRYDIDKIQYDKNFVILDAADQKTLIKECQKELNIDDKNYPQGYLLSEISRAKNNLLSPEEYTKRYQADFRLSKVALVYELYQKKLKNENALDFDDLIMQTIRLFMENPEVLSFYQNKFRYILIDEYQDTNPAQFTLVSMLAAGFGNICAVGDDDQSIYAFRGADMRNILEFEQTFPGAKVIKLEQNYRSTANILNAANEVIKNNVGRKSKKLWTENGSGSKIQFNRAENEREEARYIIDQIKYLHEKEQRDYRSFGVLYRINAQSRIIEDYLMSEALPYKVVGGMKFYDRKEIKDIIAYLRFIYNPADFVSLKRIINEPKRGIGKTSMDNIQKYMNQNEVNCWYVLDHIQDIPDISRSVAAIREFTESIKEFSLLANDGEHLVSELIKTILEKTGYINVLRNEESIENQTRIENIMEFIAVAEEYEREAETPNLSDFLENIALVTDMDENSEDSDYITLMTIHSAKGLEFPVVFIPGMEEGVFPGYRSIGSDEDIEEERRLCYVGITRAREKLYISCSRMRTLFGNTSCNAPSRFIEEIPEELMEGYQKYEKLSSDFEEANHYALNHIGYMPQKSQVTRPVAASNYLDRIGGHKISATQVNNDLSVFEKGKFVMHKRFGAGVITNITPENDDLMLEIMFENAGMKRLMAKYAQLEV
ncbi:MAG: DNA helicase PcrA [Clostridia bacterium]|nr:DNA helicase PcrA [Clostridia bacterium]